jgi:hypothetical protein
MIIGLIRSDLTTSDLNECLLCSKQFHANQIGACAFTDVYSMLGTICPECTGLDQGLLRQRGDSAVYILNTYAAQYFLSPSKAALAQAHRDTKGWDMHGLHQLRAIRTRNGGERPVTYPTKHPRSESSLSRACFYGMLPSLRYGPSVHPRTASQGSRSADRLRLDSLCSGFPGGRAWLNDVCTSSTRILGGKRAGRGGMVGLVPARRFCCLHTG